VHGCSNYNLFVHSEFPPLLDYLPWVDPQLAGLGRRAQTPKEVAFVKECTTVTYHRSCVVRGVRFTTAREAHHLKTDNSGFTMPCGPRNESYGYIKDLISVCVAGVTLYAAHVHWYTFECLWCEFIPVVNKRADPDLTHSKPVVWLKDVYAQNVGYWPLSLKAPTGQRLACISRSSDFKDFHV
jgi:hypothetical protein